MTLFDINYTKVYYLKNLSSQFMDIMLIEENTNIKHNVDFIKYTSKNNFVCYTYSHKLILVGNTINFEMYGHNFKYFVIDVLQSLTFANNYAVIAYYYKDKNIQNNVFFKKIIFIIFRQKCL